MGSESLEYRIGGLEIDPAKLRVNDDRNRPSHKYVVRQEGDRTVALYGCVAPGHRAVFEHYGLDSDRDNQKNIGGGFFLMKDNRFIMNGDSGDYLGISKSAAKAFSLLLLHELPKHSVTATEHTVYGALLINPFWSRFNAQSAKE